MKTLQINSITRHLLEKLVDNPPHALLLVGPSGAGKYTLGKAWAKEVTKSNFALTEIAPDEKGTISITTMRALYGQLSSKQKGYHVVIIQDADSMGIEAQNAFLKLLEEPKEGIIFVLTTSQPQVLLPTIHSRVQQIIVRPVSDDAIRAIVQAAAKLSQTAANMLQDETYATQQKQSMQLAKQLLGTTTYEQLLITSKLTTDKTLATHTLEALQRMLLLQLAKATSKKQTEQFTNFIANIDDCLQKIMQNGNVRIQLLHLFSKTLV
jgi:DNA polymerase-3 subunit delta'